jgi:hypothetical protein
MRSFWTSGRFIVDCGLNLASQLGRDFIDVVNGAGVFGGLLQDILFGLAFGDIVASRHEIRTAQYLSHVGLLN